MDRNTSMYMDMENETVISDRLDLGEISPDVFLHHESRQLATRTRFRQSVLEDSLMRGMLAEELYSATKRLFGYTLPGT